MLSQIYTFTLTLTFLSVRVFVFYYIGLINMLNACPIHINLKVYRPRKPQDSAYYRCVEDCFETFEQVYQERFEQKFGFFRPYVRQVIYRYLDCGILKNGFARVRCEDCGHEYLLTWIPGFP